MAGTYRPKGKIHGSGKDRGDIFDSQFAKRRRRGKDKMKSDVKINLPCTYLDENDVIYDTK